MSATNSAKSTTNGTAKPVSSSQKSPIIIRQAYLSDNGEIGRIAAEVYYDAALTLFLSPHRGKYYSHYERGYRQRALKRMLDPRSLTFVACEAAHPEKPIGAVQFLRLGDDEGAQRQIKSKASVWLVVLNWVYWAWCLALLWLTGGDKSEDPEATKLFLSWVRDGNTKVWEAHGERWHVQSCIVGTKFQGRGIGKMLMAEVTRRAEDEGVVIGLEASPHGEWLYRSVGFRLLARFEQVNGSEQLDTGDAGGFMLWTPRVMKGDKKTL